MAVLSSVDAMWTFHNERRVAKSDVMLITGAFAAKDPGLPKGEYRLATPTMAAPVAEDPSTVAHGSCFCGKVHLKLPLALKPIFSVICHCADCREWCSVSSLPILIFPLEETASGDEHQIPLKITAGPTLLTYVQRTPDIRRYFTTCCGTRLFTTELNEKANFRVCVTYPTLFPAFPFEGAVHVHCREGNIDEREGTRFQDLPAQAGGSGIMVK